MSSNFEEFIGKPIWKLPVVVDRRHGVRMDTGPHPCVKCGHTADAHYIAYSNYWLDLCARHDAELRMMPPTPGPII